MKELFSNYGIELTNEKVEKFNIFYSLLIEYNAKFNLTSIIEEREVKVKHFLDSALGLPYFNDKDKIIEIGSGAGFPSVPLKILNENFDFTLVEATEKKCGFLETVKRELGFSSFKVVCGRAEDLGKNNNYREKFGFVTARAVANLRSLSEYCLPFLKVGGKFVCYKGETDETKEAMTAIKKLGGKTDKVIDLELPDNYGKRKLILIDKACSTPLIYPRINNKIKDKPL